MAICITMDEAVFEVRMLATEAVLNTKSRLCCCGLNWRPPVLDSVRDDQGR